MEGISFTVSIRQFKDYIVFKPKHRNPGTTIILKLKKEVELDAIYISLKSQVYCSPIPIQISIKNEIAETLNARPNEIGEKELFGSKYKLAEKNDIKVWKWDSTIQDIEFRLSIVYRLENNSASFRMKDHKKSVLSVIKGFQSKLSICGFAIHLPVENLCWDIGRV
ncbi:hypothetical protein GH810_03445 [Acetobacterium paludosum]|uniref:Uncharacterized protein n=1 Tax=Acetobacterium paludosum TaxID=52693 RepID=A0A923KRK4_9FIRM|nr:hypothetical protein [Acetobacterium paludosum]MBC3887362.1 hypothetical protein [Acetobacterium paludosum]